MLQVCPNCMGRGNLEVTPVAVINESPTKIISASSILIISFLMPWESVANFCILGTLISSLFLFNPFPKNRYKYILVIHLKFVYN